MGSDRDYDFFSCAALKEYPLILTAKHFYLYLLGLFVFCSVGGSEALAAAHVVKFLHIAANEGNSSGGHAAIRFDTETFHFQHDSAGIIRLQRLDSQSFDHVYAVLGNRLIHESWIEVSADTYAQLLDGFTQALLIQDEQLRILESLQCDVALFEFLLQHHQTSGTPLQSTALPLKGLGYFATADYKAAAGSAAGQKLSVSQNLRSLNSLINSVYGENFIAQRIAETEAVIRSRKLQTAPVVPESLAAERYPVYSPPASAVYADDRLALAALQLVQATPQLVPGSYWLPAGDSFRLSPEEGLLLQSFSEKLTKDLVRLVNSTRSDWGFPFIVGMARLLSIEASLRSGRLVFLNLYPDYTESSAGDDFIALSPVYLPAMKQEAERRFQQKRQELFNNSEMREADFAALEALGNKLMEFEKSLADGVQPRQLPQNPIPSRLALPPDLHLSDISETELQQELEAARSVEREYAQALAKLYAYDLFKRNCVTEIFSAINRILTSSSADSSGKGQFVRVETVSLGREESLQRLGGYIDPLHGLNFIPAISSREVAACYSVTAQRDIPSYRSVQLAEMKKREAALLVFLRESNTITSTLYRRTPQDSPFLFFTDDTFFLRPVYGAFNLLAGIGESLLGLVALPVEGPNRLYLGAKGILFSLPELFFINLRKGTNEYVAETW